MSSADSVQAERFGGVVVGVEIGVYRGSRAAVKPGGRRRPVREQSQPVREQREEALDLVEPSRRGRGEADLPNQLRIDLVL